MKVSKPLSLAPDGWGSSLLQIKLLTLLSQYPCPASEYYAASSQTISHLKELLKILTILVLENWSSNRHTQGGYHFRLVSEKFC